MYQRFYSTCIHLTFLINIAFPASCSFMKAESAELTSDFEGLGENRVFPYSSESTQNLVTQKNFKLNTLAGGGSYVLSCIENVHLPVGGVFSVYHLLFL